ncbi:MAG: hypothetical protein ACJA08_000022 [Cyclobacteriaceae bacterium]|jgi:hypothetical protein
MFFRILISISLLGCFFLTKGANDDPLHKADSLFKSKKYTEAFDLYSTIYAEGSASPAMLARMAFIKEGLGNYTEALFYLDHYYKKTSDKKVLEKMRDLAEENSLSGFEYSDYKFIVNNINKYGDLVIMGLLALSLLSLSIIYFKAPKGASAAPWLALQLFLLIPAALVLNEFFNDNEAIIKQDQTVMMQGPSAGSEPLELIAKGNKVKVIEAEPIWTKIRIGETEAYVRSNRLLKLM